MKTMKKVLISLSVCAILVTCMVPCSLAVSEEDYSNCEIIAPKYETIFYKGIMPSEKVLDFPVDCNTLTGSVNL